MATTKRRKTKTRTKSRTQNGASRPIDVAVSTETGIEMKGERLVVKLSRESHPDVFEIDKLMKQVQKAREAHKNRRKMRDFCEFLAETEKSLQIILSNHLEAALKQYLR